MATKSIRRITKLATQGHLARRRHLPQLYLSYMISSVLRILSECSLSCGKVEKEIYRNLCRD